MSEVVHALCLTDGVERFADQALQVTDSALGEAADECPDCGKGFLDQVEIRLVERQIALDDGGVLFALNSIYHRRDTPPKPTACLVGCS